MDQDQNPTTITLSWPKAIGVLLGFLLGLVTVVGLPVLAIAKLGFFVSLFYCIVFLLVVIAAAVFVSAAKQRSWVEAKPGWSFLGIAGLLMVTFVGLTSSPSHRSAPGLSPQSSGRDWASASRAERWQLCVVMSDRMRRTGSDVTPSLLHLALTEYFDGAGSQDSIASVAGLCAALAGH